MQLVSINNHFMMQIAEIFSCGTEWRWWEERTKDCVSEPDDDTMLRTRGWWELGQPGHGHRWWAAEQCEHVAVTLLTKHSTKRGTSTEHWARAGGGTQSSPAVCPDHHIQDTGTGTGHLWFDIYINQRDWNHWKHNKEETLRYSSFIYHIIVRKQEQKSTNPSSSRWPSWLSVGLPWGAGWNWPRIDSGWGHTHTHWHKILAVPII